MTDRVPPNNVEAEKAALGAALLSQDAARGITEKLTSQDFYRPTHQQVFDIISELVSQGNEVDALMVADRYDGDKLTILDLSSSCTSTAMWSKHADIIKTDANLRRFIETVRLYESSAYDADDDTVIGEAAGALLRLQDTGSAQSVSLGDSISRRIEDYKSPTPYFRAIASNVNLHFGDLTIIAGRPGTGKTAYAIANADLWSKRFNVAFYTFEMSTDELADRFISRCTKQSTAATYDGITEAEVEIYREHTYEMRSRKLHIKECSGMSENQLAASLKSFAFAGGQIAVIDYLQIAYEMTRSGENADLTRLSKMLRRTAKATGLAIVALSQFSRDGDAEEDTKIRYPRLKHLRGSGSLEQDAANVCLMYAYPDLNTPLGQSARAALVSGEGGVKLALCATDERVLIRLDWQKVRHGRREVDYAMFNGTSMDYEEVYEV